MRIELLRIGECPNWMEAANRLDRVLAELGVEPDEFIIRRVSAPEPKFRGSPTILLDGHDPFVAPEADQLSSDGGLTCRIYDTPDGPGGAPTPDQIRDVIVEQMPGGDD